MNERKEATSTGGAAGVVSPSLSQCTTRLLGGVAEATTHLLVSTYHYDLWMRFPLSGCVPRARESSRAGSRTGGGGARRRSWTHCRRSGKCPWRRGQAAWQTHARRGRRPGSPRCSQTVVRHEIKGKKKIDTRKAQMARRHHPHTRSCRARQQWQGSYYATGFADKSRPEKPTAKDPPSNQLSCHENCRRRLASHFLHKRTPWRRG